MNTGSVNGMNASANPGPDGPLNAPGKAPVSITRTRLLYWSIRREFWENRSLYIAPLAVAGVIVFGFLISTFHPLGGMAASSFDESQHGEDLTKPYDFAALILMGATLIVALFYCLEALHGERRDRSILFWKSLPVSDLITVLAKASIPLLILPLVTFAITIATQLIMLLLSTAILAASGRNPAMLWTQMPWSSMSVGLLFHLVAMHGLWYAPFYGWLLLVSSWARRAAFLWAILPSVAIGVVEKLAFNSMHFAGMLGSRFGGGGDDAPAASGSMAMPAFTFASLGDFLTSPGLWVGLVLTAVFLALAVRQRRYGEPI